MSPNVVLLNCCGTRKDFVLSQENSFVSKKLWRKKIFFFLFTFVKRDQFGSNEGRAINSSSVSGLCMPKRSGEGRMKTANHCKV